MYCVALQCVVKKNGEFRALLQVTASEGILLRGSINYMKVLEERVDIVIIHALISC